MVKGFLENVSYKQANRRNCQLL